MKWTKLKPDDIIQEMDFWVSREDGYKPLTELQLPDEYCNFRLVSTAQVGKLVSETIISFCNWPIWRIDNSPPEANTEPLDKERRIDLTL